MARKRCEYVWRQLSMRRPGWVLDCAWLSQFAKMCLAEGAEQEGSTGGYRYDERSPQSMQTSSATKFPRSRSGSLWAERAGWSCAWLSHLASRRPFFAKFYRTGDMSLDATTTATVVSVFLIPVVRIVENC